MTPESRDSTASKHKQWVTPIRGRHVRAPACLSIYSLEGSLGQEIDRLAQYAENFEL